MVSADSENSMVPGDASAAATPVRLAHLSDPHLACLDDITARDLASKRLFGYLRWKLQRGAGHGSSVLAALKADLKQTRPDQIAVTGDLTHLGRPAEYKKARQWLQELGSPSQVTVIPGNHDAYVKSSWPQGMVHWTEYMTSDACRENDPKAGTAEPIFPSLRIRGCVAIIGVSTARPSALHLAVGSIGVQQLHNLATILDQTTRKHLYRVVLIHHPPAPGTVNWRKRLTDAADLQSLLKQYGAELVLHGHAHRSLHNSLPTPAGNIPVMGAPSISALDRTPERRARYYIYQITPGSQGYETSLEVRIYSPEDNRFIRENEPRKVE